MTDADLPPRPTLALHVSVDLLSCFTVESLAHPTEAFSISLWLHDNCLAVSAHDDKLVTRLDAQLPSHLDRNNHLALRADPNRPNNARHSISPLAHYVVLALNFKQGSTWEEIVSALRASQ